jgi:hypothetical protein
MKFFSFIVLSTLCFGALASPTPTEEKHDDKCKEPKAYIKDVDAWGDGCKYVDVKLVDNDTLLKIKFKKLEAELEKKDKKDYEKCKLSIKIAHDKHCKFAITDAKYEGKVKIDKKVTAKLESTQNIVEAGGNPDEEFSKKWNGKLYDNYYKGDNSGNLVWSKCEKDGKDEVVIITEVSVKTHEKHKKGSIEHEESKYELKWRKCKK